MRINPVVNEIDTLQQFCFVLLIQLIISYITKFILNWNFWTKIITVSLIFENILESFLIQGAYSNANVCGVGEVVFP